MSDMKKNNIKPSYLRRKIKHFPSSVREWNNSIYVYNKNSLESIPTTTISVMKIIRSYFDLFNGRLERKMRRKRLLLRNRRLSSNRIYLSNSEFKHTNNKVLINVYLYNRQKYNYLSKLSFTYLDEMFFGTVRKLRNNSDKKLSRINIDINIDIIKKLKSIYKKTMDIIKKTNNNKYILINAMKNNPRYKISSFKNITKSTTKFYKTVLIKYMKRLFIYFFYKQLIYINRSKLNYTYLQILRVILEKIYNKNVEFNLINLKDIFLSSDIMSEVVRLKLIRNRKHLFKLMNAMRNKAFITKKNIFLKKVIYLTDTSELKDLRDNNNNKLREFIVKNLKYKDVTGFRLEAKGRLTRRHKAARSLYRVKYKGNLSDLDASRKGLSSIILKGNLRSNIQYTKCYSKTRIGTFGLKGWVSGY